MILDRKQQKNALSLGKLQQSLATTQLDMAMWQANLRAAVLNSISTDDMREIVERQVEKAKAGDANAIKFLMAQISAAAGGGINITNVITDVETAARMARERENP